MRFEPDGWTPRNFIFKSKVKRKRQVRLCEGLPDVIQDILRVFQPQTDTNRRVMYTHVFPLLIVEQAEDGESHLLTYFLCFGRQHRIG